MVGYYSGGIFFSGVWGGFGFGGCCDFYGKDSFVFLGLVEFLGFLGSVLLYWGGVVGDGVGYGGLCVRCLWGGVGGCVYYYFGFL